MIVIFRSGIRKIELKVEDIEQAKQILLSLEPDAFTDLTWNWSTTIIPDRTKTTKQPKTLETKFEN